MLHLFPHKFSRLRRWRFSFALIFPSSFNGFLFWHSKMVSPQEVQLDVSGLNVQSVKQFRRRRFGRRRSGALQLKAGGTRFVVSQTSLAVLSIKLATGPSKHDFRVD
jgi:hypothetical protein